MANKAEDWSTMPLQGPFRAEMPASGNGYVHVLDKNGAEIALCSADDPARAATAIAFALNQTFPAPAKETNTPEPDPLPETQRPRF